MPFHFSKRSRQASQAQAPALRERRINGEGTGKAESYEQLRLIGEGGQGKVWIVKRKRDKKLLVRKEMPCYGMFSTVPNEQLILEKVIKLHPRIIEFHHACYLDGTNMLALYFEYCEGGDLEHYMPRTGERGQPEKFLWSCFVQLADAVAFLHYGYNRFAKGNPSVPPKGWARVVHRDVKPANVFLRHKISDRHPIPEFVLGDFGLATLIAETEGAGTDEWLGPENPITTKQSDVWGVGACIHALAHGRGPVPPKPASWPRGKLAEEEWFHRPESRQPKELPTSYSDKLNWNMMSCLRRDPGERVDSEELIKNLVADRPKPRR